MGGKYVEKSVSTRNLSLLSKARNHLKAIMLGAKLFIRPIRITYRYPIVKEIPQEGYRGFIVLDDQKCIGCSLCARICPASAMKMFQPQEKKLRPAINYERCVFCGYCVDICPENALKHARTHDVVFESGESMLYIGEKFTVDPDTQLLTGNVRMYRVK
ncbi:MAG: NADH-quinone oxidoreductase subunit I, partial [Fervidicoccaceae archaeon]